MERSSTWPAAERRVAPSGFVHGRAFEFTGVEAGRYKLGVSGLAQSTEIDVKDGETRDVTLK
jgi:hypothetical protein